MYSSNNLLVISKLPECFKYSLATMAYDAICFLVTNSVFSSIYSLCNSPSLTLSKSIPNEIIIALSTSFSSSISIFPI